MGWFSRKKTLPEMTRSEMVSYFQEEMEKNAIRNYQKSSMKNTPLGGLVILEGLNNTSSILKNRIYELANLTGLKEDDMEKVIKEAFRRAYDNLLEG